MYSGVVRRRIALCLLLALGCLILGIELLRTRIDPDPAAQLPMSIQEVAELRTRILTAESRSRGDLGADYELLARQDDLIDVHAMDEETRSTELLGRRALMKWCIEENRHSVALDLFARFLAAVDESTPPAFVAEVTQDIERVTEKTETWADLEETLLRYLDRVPPSLRRPLRVSLTRVGLKAWRYVLTHQVGRVWNAERDTPIEVLDEQRQRLNRLHDLHRELARDNDENDENDELLDGHVTVLAILGHEEARQQFTDLVTARLDRDPPPSAGLLVRICDLFVSGWYNRREHLLQARAWADLACRLAADEDELALATYAVCELHLRIAVGEQSLSADDPAVTTSIEALQSAADLSQQPTTAARGQLYLGRAMQITQRFDETTKILDSLPIEDLDPSLHWYHHRLAAAQWAAEQDYDRAIDAARESYATAPREFRTQAQWIVNTMSVSSTFLGRN